MFIIKRFSVTDNIKPEHLLENLVRLLNTHYIQQIECIENKSKLLTSQLWKEFSIYTEDLYRAYKEDLEICFSKFEKNKINEEFVNDKFEKYRTSFRQTTYVIYNKFYPLNLPK
jgi:hypothetical protein